MELTGQGFTRTTEERVLTLDRVESLGVHGHAALSWTRTWQGPPYSLSVTMAFLKSFSLYTYWPRNARLNLPAPMHPRAMSDQSDQRLIRTEAETEGDRARTLVVHGVDLGDRQVVDLGQVLLDVVLGVVRLDAEDVLVVAQPRARVLAHEGDGHVGEADAAPRHLGALRLSASLAACLWPCVACGRRGRFLPLVSGGSFSSWWMELPTRQSASFRPIQSR